AVASACGPGRARADARAARATTSGGGGGRVRCGPPRAPPRERARPARRGSPGPPRRGRWSAPEPAATKAERAAAEAFAGRTHADWVAQQITETARSRSQNTEPGSLATTWSTPAIAALAAAGALVVAAVVASV